MIGACLVGAGSPETVIEGLVLNASDCHPIQTCDLDELFSLPLESLRASVGARHETYHWVGGEHDTYVAS